MPSQEAPGGAGVVAGPGRGVEPEQAEPVRRTRSARLLAELDTALESAPWRLVRAALLIGLVLFLAFMPVLDRSLDRSQVWGVYVASVLIGGLCLLGVRAAGGGPALTLAVFWGMWTVGIPLWHRDGTRSWAADQAVIGMLACACITFAAVGLTRGKRSGVELMRWLWIAIAAVFVPFGLFEAITGRHFSPGGPYAPPAFSPSGLFDNPNNFACVLLVCLGVLLFRLCERMGEWQRMALTMLALGAGVLIVLTLSRPAVLGMALLLVATARLAWRRAQGTPAAAPSVSERPRVRRLTRLAGYVAAPLVIAAFVVPGVSRINPLVMLLAPDREAIARSDELRLALVEAGLRMWTTQPWIGVGGGRFATLLEQDPGRATRLTPMHNSFVQLLTEYGIALTVPLLVLLVWLIVRVVRARPEPETHGAPTGLDTLGARYLIGLYLGVFALAGLLVSSALAWTMWWLMLAAAVTTAWWLGGVPRTPADDDTGELPVV